VNVVVVGKSRFRAATNHKVNSPAKCEEDTKTPMEVLFNRTEQCEPPYVEDDERVEEELWNDSSCFLQQEESEEAPDPNTLRKKLMDVMSRKTYDPYRSPPLSPIRDETTC
jgi:hypothetical protein